MFKFYSQIWNALGFDGLFDFLAITLANHSLKSFVVQIMIATAMVGTFPYYVEEWVFSPFTGVMLITIMVVVDTLLGAFVALKQGECFNIAKFTRLAPILLSHLIVLSFSFHMAKIDNFLFAWLPEAVFAFFSGRNLMSIVRNMVIMKWLRGDFLQYLIDRVKPDLMDAMKPDKTHSHEKVNSN
jgi:hypothetical protein